MLTNIGGTSVPFFYSLKTNRKYIGLEKNSDNLFKNLSEYYWEWKTHKTKLYYIYYNNCEKYWFIHIFYYILAK